MLACRTDLVPENREPESLEKTFIEEAK